MLDADKDGKLTVNDFEQILLTATANPALASSKSRGIFVTLQSKLDFNNDGFITDQEFCLGLIKQAMDAPVSSMLRTPPSSSEPILFCLTRLEQAANNSIKESLKRIFNWVREVVAS